MENETKDSRESWKVLIENVMLADDALPDIVLTDVQDGQCLGFKIGTLADLKIVITKLSTSSAEVAALRSALESTLLRLSTMRTMRKVDYEFVAEPAKEALTSTAPSGESEHCTYTRNDKAPYPRVAYDAECGYQFMLTEGYKFDEFNQRTNELVPPWGMGSTGKCSKCKRVIASTAQEAK